MAGFDSVSVCLSKGLGAPAGSVLLGYAGVHRRGRAAGARPWAAACGRPACLPRRGSMRSSITCRRLAQDHANAEYLAQGLRALGLHVEPPQTNIVYVAVPPPRRADLKSHLEERGILATITPRTRLATHLDVPRARIEAVLRAFRDYPQLGLKQLRPGSRTIAADADFERTSPRSRSASGQGQARGSRRAPRQIADLLRLLGRRGQDLRHAGGRPASSRLEGRETSSSASSRPTAAPKPRRCSTIWRSCRRS